MEEKSHLAADLYQKNVCFIEGFQQFHMQVKEAQLKTGIATNADDVTLKITNSILNLEQFFGEHIYSISQVNYICKPDPAIYLLAAKKLNVDPKECIAIEDSAHGIEAAKKAGIFCIGINTGKNRANVQHSDLIIDSYDELELATLLSKKTE
jgi:beta-phosphoglucomutase